MKNLSGQSILGISICLLAAVPGINAQVPAKVLTDQEMVYHMQSRDFALMGEVLGILRIEKTDPGHGQWTLAPGIDASPEARAAIIDALAYHMEQYGAWSDGKPYDQKYIGGVPDGWGPDLATLVLALKDEASIPALLQATGIGTVPHGGLLDFGMRTLEPAMECAEDETGWTGAVVGCMRYLSEAVYLWKPRLSPSQIARLRALVAKRLSIPIADYQPEHTGVRYAYEAAALAVSVGWTENLKRRAQERLTEIDTSHDWRREAITSALEGELRNYLKNKYGLE